MTNAIIINGEPVWCGSPVRVWNETGLGFPGRPKRTETRAVWLHWTGGENDAHGVHATLVQRGLSVNFCVDQAGVIWQFCDAALATAHAGGENVVLSANPWGVGIEVINRATPMGEHEKWPRPVVEDMIRCQHFKATDFYPDQVTSVVSLCKALTGAYGLPMDVPRDADGKLAARTLTVTELRAFHGVGGHYHNHLGKRDPGTRILRAVAAAGGKAVA